MKSKDLIANSDDDFLQSNDAESSVFSDSPTSPKPLPRLERYQTHLKYGQMEFPRIYTSQEPSEYPNNAIYKLEESTLKRISRLYDHLDQERPEVIEAESANSKSIITWLFSKNSAADNVSYSNIRDIYRAHRRSENSKVTVDGRLTRFLNRMSKSRRQITKLLTSSKNILFFMFIEWVRVIIFCTIYLFEVQYNAVSPIDENDPNFQPLYLHTKRLGAQFNVLVFLSLLTLAAAAMKIIFSANAYHTIRQPLLILDLAISVTFVCLFFLPRRMGETIYVPYFLMSFSFVPFTKSILRARSKLQLLSISNYQEKLILLAGNVIHVIYLGLCFFTYFETNFSDFSNIGIDPSKMSQLNQTVKAGKISVLDSAYFMVITMSTVGYGDITPKTAGGKICIIFVILYALILFPGLISDLQETLSAQQSGVGAYTRGIAPYFIICGDFQNLARVKGAVDMIYDNDRKKRFHIVLLARHKITPELKAILSDLKFRNRVYYIQGKGLDVEDMRRVDLKNSMAAFILANASAEEPTDEDQHNTMRAWAFDDFSPNTPLYVETLLPQSNGILERATTGTVCLEQLKHLLIGYNCIYRGVGTLLINLMQNGSKFHSFTDPWQAQYGDGESNEFFESPLNARFIGQRFNHVAWFLYKKFQIALCGVNTLDPRTKRRHIRLNPGASYVFAKDDSLLMIGLSQKDVDSAFKTTSYEFQRTELQFPIATVSRPHSSVELGSVVEAFGQFVIGYPKYMSNLDHVPLCYLLSSPAKNFDSIQMDPNEPLSSHILVCTDSYSLNLFLCTLRSAHLTRAEFRPILILCEREPTECEFQLLAQFPKLYIQIGSPQSRLQLEKACIRTADKVVILGLHNDNINGQDVHEGFADAPSIMVAHMIYDMFHTSGIRKTVIMDLQKLRNVKFLRPTARKIRSRKRRNIDDYESQTDNDLFHNAYYTPVFASGRVLTTSMLEKIIYKMHFQPSILQVAYSLCGIYSNNSNLNDDPSLCYIACPLEFVGKAYIHLFQSLCCSGIIAIGILRDDVTPTLGNRLPFVITNPLPSLLLRHNDLIYIIASTRQLGEN